MFIIFTHVIPSMQVIFSNYLSHFLITTTSNSHISLLLALKSHASVAASNLAPVVTNVPAPACLLKMIQVDRIAVRNIGRSSLLVPDFFLAHHALGGNENVAKWRGSFTVHFFFFRFHLGGFFALFQIRQEAKGCLGVATRCRRFNLGQVVPDWFNKKIY